MLHVQIATHSRSAGHSDLLFYLTSHRYLSVSDSYYYGLWPEFEALFDKSKESFQVTLARVLKDHLLHLVDQINALEKGQTIFFVWEINDQSQDGFWFEYLADDQDDRILVSSVYSPDGGHEIGNIKKAIRPIEDSERPKFYRGSGSIKIEKEIIIKSFRKAAENIRIVDNFDFLYTWKV